MASFTFETKLPIPISAKELQERIKSLFAIKDALDSEIETLIGRKADHSGNLYHCLRCDYKWNSRLMRRPNGCPKCRTKKFDQKPAYTYEEKLKRKQEVLAKRDQYVESFKAYTKQTEEDLRHPPISLPSLTGNPPPMPHSVLTRQVSSEADSIQNVALTPPPVAPMSLRERLAQMSKGGDALRLPSQETIMTGQLSNGAAADGAHPEQNESASEDELMEAINGENDVT